MPNVRRCEITVCDYRKGDAKTLPEPPELYHVEAHCVGGDEGVFAVFRKGKKIFLASGDDGHWWVIATFSDYWAAGLIIALVQANSERRQ